MSAAAITTAASGLTLLAPTTAFSEDSEIDILGPKKGYSPQIGTLVSMMAWMRSVVLMSVKGMSQKDLDYLFDANPTRSDRCSCTLRPPIGFTRSILSKETT